MRIQWSEINILMTTEIVVPNNFMLSDYVKSPSRVITAQNDFLYSKWGRGSVHGGENRAL